MLYLDRHENQSIILRMNDGMETEVEVRVMAITDLGVKLGFSAPKYVKILRKEIVEDYDEKDD